MNPNESDSLNPDALARARADYQNAMRGARSTYYASAEGARAAYNAATSKTPVTPLSPEVEAELLQSHLNPRCLTPHDPLKPIYRSSPPRVEAMDARIEWQITALQDRYARDESCFLAKVPLVPLKPKPPVVTPLLPPEVEAERAALHAWSAKVALGLIAENQPTP